jgi:hypothetical protein
MSTVHEKKSPNSLQKFLQRVKSARKKNNYELGETLDHSKVTGDNDVDLTRPQQGKNNNIDTKICYNILKNSLMLYHIEL